MRQRLEKIYEEEAVSAASGRRRRMVHGPGKDQLTVDAANLSWRSAPLSALDMYGRTGRAVRLEATLPVPGMSAVAGVIVANDQTVKAGAWFPITGKRTFGLGDEDETACRLFTSWTSAGVFLPMQDEIFPDKEYLCIFSQNNAKMSVLASPRSAAVMGARAAGGAYLPIMR